MEGYGSGAGSRSIQINYGSGCGSRRPKNIHIRMRILNTGKESEEVRPAVLARMLLGHVVLQVREELLGCQLGGGAVAALVQVPCTKPDTKWKTTDRI
jgi:hypothetical protein